jgi:hypothetical protein
MFAINSGKESTEQKAKAENLPASENFFKRQGCHRGVQHPGCSILTS